MRDSTNAAILNDLAVAYVAVAERDQALMPMLRALDAVNVALARDSTYAPAYFNRALILERLFLVRGAAAAWSKYITSERDDRWKSEARAHLQGISQLQNSLAARFFPQRARERFFALLGAWGTAIGRGDRTVGDSLLRHAIALRDSLGSDARDQSVAMTLDWLRAKAADPLIASRIAPAFVDLATGIALHDNLSCDAGEAALVRAEEALRTLKAPAARWAAVYRAACEANQRRLRSADKRLARTLQQATPREPALVGKALWVRGIIQLRHGNYEAANHLYENARAQFVRAGDAANEAAVSFLLTESLAFAGQAPASEVEAYKGLRGLGPSNSSRYLNILLIKVAAQARGARLWLAALDVLSEALIVERALQDHGGAVFARWTRAEILGVIGDTVGAFAELDTAAATTTLVADSTDAAAAVAQVELVRGRLLQYSDAERSRASLDRAVDGFRALDAVNWLAGALFQSASLANGRGEKDRARSELAEAISVIEHRRGAFVSADAQAQYYETVENVFDVAIHLELEEGHRDAAFDLLERERVAIRPETHSRTAAPVTSLASLSQSIPPGMLFVSYAVLPDRIAIWYARQGAWGYDSSLVGRDTVAALAQRAVREIQESGTREARTRLFDILLRPLEAQLRSARVVAAVPDRELVSVPLAALWDSAKQRYVVEDRAILTEPSASFMIAASRAAKSRDAGMSALIVGNPTELTSSDTSLADLPGAAAEAAQVAELYPQRKVLTGEAANRRSVIEWLSRQAVFHFAGHAVFDATYPERSYLALSDSGQAGTGRLEAREIAHLSLSNTKIVVLSACRTLPARPSRSGAVAGIAFSFLRAGAPAIVSTLWDIVDDDAADVVVAFHQRLRDGLEPAEALRRAQEAALRANERRRGAAGTWAAFVYTGPWTLNRRSD